MVPPLIQVVDALPLTANGKVDRAALRRRLPRREAVAAATSAGAPAGDLEQRVAAIWAQALRIDRIGRDDNLFELGGDSLVAAQIAGRMLEEVPEVAGLFFDELLRRLLEEPTVAALTGRLAEAGDAAPAAPADDAGPSAAGLVHLAGPAGAGDAVVLVRAGGDGSGGFAPLAACLSGGDAVYDLEVETPGDVPLDRLAVRWADAAAATGAARIRLAGYGPAAMLAVEVGRVLTERGQVVGGVTLIGGYRPAGPANGTGGLSDVVRRHEPTLYAGDLTLIRPAAGPSAGADAVQVWEDMCLGDLRVVAVDAEHDDLLGEPCAALIAAAVDGAAA
jgi:pyochelin synthetase